MRIVTMTITYDDNRLNSIKNVVKFEESIENKKYQCFPYVENNCLKLKYHIND